MRLTALSGTPLDEPIVRETVIATAHGLAERSGVAIRHLVTDTTSITVTLDADRIAGLGFLAELRRLTNRWYEDKYRDGPLWGTPRHDPELGE
jgi:hypothetical protein